MPVRRALALSHLGVYSLAVGKTGPALRYLHRAVTVKGESLACRVRVRLNLCAALNQLGEHAEALALLQAAYALPGVRAADGAWREAAAGEACTLAGGLASLHPWNHAPLEMPLDAFEALRAWHTTALRAQH